MKHYSLLVLLSFSLAFCSSSLISGEYKIFFDLDSTEISADDKAQLQSIDGTVVRITGHADSRHSDDYNLDLGMRRAQAVEAVLRSDAELASHGEFKATGKHDEDRFVLIETSDPIFKLHTRRFELQGPLHHLYDEVDAAKVVF